MENENEKFSPSPLFLYQASSSRRDSLQPLRIFFCSVAASSAFVALLLSKAAAAVAPVLLLFLLGPRAPPPPYNVQTMAPRGGSRRGSTSWGGLTRSTPAAASPAIIQVPSTFTPDQNAQIFELALLKAQADLQRAQANLQRVQAERDAIQARS